MPGLIRRILDFSDHSVFRRLLKSVAVLALYAAFDDYFLAWVHTYIDVPDGVRTLTGAVLSVLLVLRTNSAYDRWWEARKLWGQLINESRNMVLKLYQTTTAPLEEKEAAAALVVAFPVRLKDHLRAPGSPHQPLATAGELFRTVDRWRQAGYLDGHSHQLIDRHVSALMDVCGACERIRNTPLPNSHRALIPQLLFFFLLVLPLDLPSTWQMMLVVCSVGYFMLGLEYTAEELEEPFGTDSDDLPLETYCATIERSVQQVVESGKKAGHQGGGPDGRE